MRTTLILIFLIVLMICRYTIHGLLFSNEGKKRNQRKIAFLFLAKEDFPFDVIWHAFFHQSPKGLYNIYVHSDPGYKFPFDSFFTKFRIKKQIPTKWGDVSLVSAIQLLLQEALKDDASNQAFCLISDSCIPVQPFSVFQQLVNTSKSVIQACPWNDQDFGLVNIDRWKPHLLQYGFTEDLWRKSEMYFMLTRKHAKTLSEIDLTPWRTIFAADEHVFPTVLARLSLENETTCSKGFASITWKYSDVVHPQTFHPKDLSPEVLWSLKTSSLFNSRCSNVTTASLSENICHFTARKFAPTTRCLLLLKFLPILLNPSQMTSDVRLTPGRSTMQYLFRLFRFRISDTGQRIVYFIDHHTHSLRRISDTATMKSLIGWNDQTILYQVPSNYSSSSTMDFLQLSRLYIFPISSLSWRDRSIGDNFISLSSNKILCTSELLDDSCWFYYHHEGCRRSFMKSEVYRFHLWDSFPKETISASDLSFIYLCS